ncbi:MAG: PAS domain S-box protein [Bacteroidota bacterium]
MPLSSSEIWWELFLGTCVTVSFAVFFIATIAINQRRYIKIQRDKLEEVKKSESKYSDLFNNVTDVVFIHSLMGEILEINHSGLAFLGVAGDEIIGKSLAEIFGPRYQRRIDSYLMEIRLRGEAAGSFSLACKNGKCLTFEYRNSLIKKNDTSIAIRGIAREITEARAISKSLRASEKRFRHLVKYSPLPMIIHSDRIIQYANDAAVKLMKARDYMDIVGKWVEEFIILGYFASDSDAPQSAKAEGERQPTILTEKLRLLNDQMIDVESASLPVIFNGKPAVHTVIRDITRSKQLEAKLREIPKQIIDAQEAERGRVSRELHDGVNQILGSVKFRLQAAETKVLPVEQKAAQDIKQTCADLEKAIEEIKRISHNLRPSVLDDLGLIAAVRNLCDDFRNRTKVEISYTSDKFPQRLPPEIELVIFRIIQEALNNIEKHSKATQVTVGITFDESLLQASIIDNGMGFSRESIKPTNGNRRGLGLDTMRERAVFVGGSTTIQSEPYHGTQICVKIPLGEKKEEVV